MANQHPLAIQATNGFVPTPSDTVNVKADVANLTAAEYVNIYSGAGGSIKVTMVDGTDLTFANVPAGVFMPILVKRIWATPAPPAGILALFGRFGV